MRSHGGNDPCLWILLLLVVLAKLGRYLAVAGVALALW